MIFVVKKCPEWKKTSTRQAIVILIVCKTTKKIVINFLIQLSFGAFLEGFYLIFVRKKNIDDDSHHDVRSLSSVIHFLHSINSFVCVFLITLCVPVHVNNVIKTSFCDLDHYKNISSQKKNKLIFGHQTSPQVVYFIFIFLRNMYKKK